MTPWSGGNWQFGQRKHTNSVTDASGEGRSPGLFICSVRFSPVASAGTKSVLTAPPWTKKPHRCCISAVGEKLGELEKSMSIMGSDVWSACERGLQIHYCGQEATNIRTCFNVGSSYPKTWDFYCVLVFECSSTGWKVIWISMKWQVCWILVKIFLKFTAK